MLSARVQLVAAQPVVALVRHSAAAVVVSRLANVMAFDALEVRCWHYQHGRVPPRGTRTVAFVAQYFIQVYMVPDRLDLRRHSVEIPVGRECDVLVVTRGTLDYDARDVPLGGGSLAFICRRRGRFPLH